MEQFKIKKLRCNSLKIKSNNVLMLDRGRHDTYQKEYLNYFKKFNIFVDLNKNNIIVSLVLNMGSLCNLFRMCNLQLRRP